jgi:hypothetical protein
VTWVSLHIHVAGFRPRFGYFNKANNITCSFGDVCDFIMVIEPTGYW